MIPPRSDAPLEASFNLDGTTTTFNIPDTALVVSVNDIVVSIVNPGQEARVLSTPGEYTATIPVSGSARIRLANPGVSGAVMIVRNRVRISQLFDFASRSQVNPQKLTNALDHIVILIARIAGDLLEAGIGTGSVGLTPEQIAKLDGIAAGAQVNPDAQEISDLLDGLYGDGWRLGSGGTAVDTDAVDARITALVKDFAWDENIQVGTDDIADGAIETDKIHDSAITEEKIEDGAVALTKLDGSAGTTDQVLAVQSDGSVAWVDAAEGLADGAVTTAKIADDAVTPDKIDGSGGSTGQVLKRQSDGSVAWDTDATATGGSGLDQSAVDARIAAKVKDFAETGSTAQVDTADIADDAVTTDKIAANAITTGLIATGAVEHNDIAQGAVGEVNISTGAVTTDKIANGAVTAAKLASDVSLGGGGAPTGYAYDYIGAAESGGHQSSATYTPTSTNLRVHTAGGTAADPDKISLPLPNSPNLNQGVTDPENFWAFYGLRDYLGYMGEGVLVKLGDTTYRLTGNETERSVSGYTIFEYAVEVAEGTAALPAANEDVAIEVFAFPRTGSEAPADLNRFIPGNFVFRGSGRNGPAIFNTDLPAEIINKGSPRNMLQVVRGPKMGGVQFYRTTYEGANWTRGNIDPSSFTDGDLPISKLSHSGGTAAQVLAINSSGSGVEWVDAAEGGGGGGGGTPESREVLLSDDNLVLDIGPLNGTQSQQFSYSMTRAERDALRTAVQGGARYFIMTGFVEPRGVTNDRRVYSFATILSNDREYMNDDPRLEMYGTMGGFNGHTGTVGLQVYANADTNAQFFVRWPEGDTGRIWGNNTHIYLKLYKHFDLIGSGGGAGTTAVARGHATGNSKTNVDDLPLGVVVFPGGRRDVIPAGLPPAGDENGGTLSTIPQVQQTFKSFGGKTISRTWTGTAWGPWVDITRYPASHTRHTTSLVPNGIVLFGNAYPTAAWKLPRVVGSPWSERDMDYYRLILTLALPATEARLGQRTQPGFYFAPTHGVHTRPSGNWRGNRADGADRTVSHQNLVWKEVYGNGIVDSDGYALQVSRTGTSHPELHGVIGFKDTNQYFTHLATFENGLAMDSSAAASNRAFQSFTGLAGNALTSGFSRARGLLVLAETAHKGSAASYADYLTQLTSNANEVFFTNRVDRGSDALRFSAGLQPTSSEPFFLINKWRDGNSSTEHGLAVHRNSHNNTWFLLHVTRDRNADGGAQKWIPDNSFSEDYWGFKSISRLDIPNLIPTGTHRINTESASSWIELPDTVAHATKLLFLVDYDPAAAEYAMTGIQDNFILSRRGKSWSRYDLGHYAAGFHNNANAAADSRYRVGFRKNASEVKVWTQNGTSFYTYGLYVLEEEGE